MRGCCLRHFLVCYSIWQAWTKALENGEALSEDVTIEMKAMYEGLARKMDNAIIQEEGK